MARLEMTTKLGHGEVTALVDEAMMQNRSRVVAKYRHIRTDEPQVEIRGSKEDLLKLKQAFEAKGHNCVVFD